MSRFLSLVTIVLLASSGRFTCLEGAEDHWQKGERILPADKAPSDAPLRRYAKSPWYQLSNFQRFHTRDAAIGIVFDFQRESSSQGTTGLNLVIRTRKGRVTSPVYGLSPLLRESRGSFEGEIKSFGLGFIQSRETFEEMELWLEQVVSLSGGTARIKVSNSILLGNPGEKTFARHWTEEEVKQFDLLEKSLQPPPPPPKGYQVVGSAVALLPGMPILAGRMGDWAAAEVIDLRTDGTVMVKFTAPPVDLQIRPKPWIAVDEATLLAASKEPNKFKPSIRVLHNGRLLVEENDIPVDQKTPLFPGVPVRTEWLGRWTDAIVLEAGGDGPVRICFDEHKKTRNFDRELERTALVISKVTLEELQKPDAEKKYQARVAGLENSFERRLSMNRPKLVNHHKIKIPEDSVTVTADMALEVGTKLGAPWGLQWYDVTVRRLNRDGSVFIRWDKWGEAWDQDADRKDLAISKIELAKLKKSPVPPLVSAVKPVAEQPQAAMPREEKYRVIFQAAGADKIRVTKLVMEVTGLELKDAKDFIEAGSFPLKQGLSKSDAEKIRKQLEDAGGTAAIEKQ